MVRQLATISADIHPKSTTQAQQQQCNIPPGSQEYLYPGKRASDPGTGITNYGDFSILVMLNTWIPSYKKIPGAAQSSRMKHMSGKQGSIKIIG